MHIYDKNHRIIKVDDALGGETSTTYDFINRVTSITYAEGSRVSYA